MGQRRSTFHQELPEEIWIHVFSFLSPKELCNLNFVSKQFQNLSNSEIIWNPLVQVQWKNKHTKIFQKKIPKFLKTWKEIFIHGEKDSKRTNISVGCFFEWGLFSSDGIL
jgi:hypothetical protein